MTLQPYGFVLRSGVLEACRPFWTGAQRLVIFTAGAGHGKSVAARQVADRTGRALAFCQCTGIDRNPVQLAEKLLGALEPLQPGLESARVLRPLYSSQTAEEALLAARDSFKAALTKLDTPPVTILVDDVHLLLDSAGLHLLRLFHDLAPAHYSLLLTTRQRLKTDGKPLFGHLEGLRVHQEQLEFSKLEVLELYREHFGIDLTPAEADRLLAATEGGWPAGLALLRSQAKRLRDGFQLKPGGAAQQYFIQECLGRFGPEVSRQLILLAQLEYIPVDLLADLDLDQAEAALGQLCDLGLFTTDFSQNDQDYYRYHHLFQEALRQLLPEEVADRAVRGFNQAASAWLLEHGRPEEALTLLAGAGDWPGMAQALEHCGATLLLSNKLQVVRDSLAHCPPQALEANVWLEAMLGQALLFTDPQRATVLLRQAWGRARAENNQYAELLAGLGLMNYQLVFNGDLWEMGRITKRVSVLVDQVKARGMSRELAGLCAFMLTTCFTYSVGYYEQAKKYAREMNEIFGVTEGSQVPPEVAVANLYVNGIRGDLRGSLGMMQSGYFQLKNAQTNPSARFLSHLIYANWCEMLPEWEDYHSLRRESYRLFPELVNNSFMGAFFHVWSLDILLAQGRWEDVSRAAQEALAVPLVTRTPHVSSQCWQYHALAAAFLGRHDEALESLGRSMRMRAKMGGAYFLLLNHNVAGGVLALVGRHRQAERVLACAIRQSEKLGDCYQRPQMHAYRAHMFLDQGRRDEAQADIKAMLACMERFRNYHFFYWEKSLVWRLMEFYLSQEEPTPFARDLLRRRFGLEVLADGSLLPRLHCSLARNRVFRPDSPESFMDLCELPGLEASLLRLLLDHQGRPVELQTAIERLWEDPSAMKDPRNSLYALVNKLRGRLALVVGKEAAKLYLPNRAGCLSLEHVDVDLSDLRAQARSAQDCLAAKRWWDAEMRFRRVAARADAFPRGFAWDGPTRELLARVSLAWIDLSLRAAEPEAALAAAELGLRIDPANDQLHKRRYALFMELDMPAKAKAAEEAYADLLGLTGRARHEIAKYLA